MAKSNRKASKGTQDGVVVGDPSPRARIVHFPVQTTLIQEPGQQPPLFTGGQDPLEAFLSDPRSTRVSDPAFRLAVLFLTRRPFRGGAALAAAKIELRRIGIDIPSVDPLSSLDPEEPMSEARTRSGARLPASWFKRFEEFWEAFADKRGRLGALTAWHRIETENLDAPVDFAAIFEGARRYRREMACRQGALKKQAEGWLNDRRWNDDIDGGDYTPDGQRLIDLFTRHVPNAEPITLYSPARGDAIRSYLARSTLDRASNYFQFLAVNQDLLSFTHGAPVPLTAVLHADLERKARERHAKLLAEGHS